MSDLQVKEGLVKRSNTDSLEECHGVCLREMNEFLTLAQEPCVGALCISVCVCARVLSR